MRFMARNDTPIKAPRFIVLAAVCIICAALYFARDVLIPLALALLLSFLLAPIIKRLEKRKIPRIAAVVLVVSVIFSFIGVLGWGVGTQLKDFVEQLPGYKQNIVAKVSLVRGNNVGGFGKAA